MLSTGEFLPTRATAQSLRWQHLCPGYDSPKRLLRLPEMKKLQNRGKVDAKRRRDELGEE